MIYWLIKEYFKSNQKMILIIICKQMQMYINIYKPGCQYSNDIVMATLAWQTGGHISIVS